MRRLLGRSLSKTRAQILGATTLLLFSVGSILFALFLHPRVPFVYGAGEATWITNPRPVSTGVFVVGLGRGPVARFSRRFSLPGPSSEATLHVRALGKLAVEVNGEQIGASEAETECLKSSCRFRAGEVLVGGENEIRVRVVNSIGPPLLRLRLEGAGIDLGTGTDWLVSMHDGPPEPAIRADDTRPYPDALQGPTPVEALRQRAGTLLVLFVASAGVFLAGRRFVPDAALRFLPVATLGVAAVFWLHLFVAKFTQIPLRLGFDGPSHAQYVRHLLEHHRLPIATEGVAFYHPPLYYLCTAGLMSLFDPVAGGAGERWLLKLLPFVSGLGIVAVTYALSRRLFPCEPSPTFFAVAIAAVLPLNVYMSAYVSNEPFFALLASLSLLAAVRVILSPNPTPKEFWLVATLLGLALLTKYTGLLLVAVLLFFIATKLLLVDGVRTARVAVISGWIAAGVLLIAGWFYLRNWLLFGDPLTWNLDLPIGLTWWQQPGFRTLHYYLGFGESIRHPWFSGFHTLWDAIYSTVWGEGLPPGAARLEQRHDLWSYELMSLGFLLALPAAGIALLGFAKATLASIRGDDPRVRTALALLTTLVYVFAVAFVYTSLRYPFWGAARAAYLHHLVAPGSVMAGVGFAAVDRWLAVRGWTAARAIFYGWFGTFLAVLALSFAG
jgi:hypothetical protein